MLEEGLALWQEGAAAKTQAGVLPRWGAAMFENGRSHLEADLRLFRTLLECLAGSESEKGEFERPPLKNSPLTL